MFNIVYVGGVKITNIFVGSIPIIYENNSTINIKFVMNINNDYGIMG